MSPIESNALPSVFLSNAPHGDELGSGVSPGGRPARFAPADDIRFGPSGSDPAQAETAGGANQNALADRSALADALGAFLSALTALFDKLAGPFSNGAALLGGSQPGQSQGQNFFKQASASSVGDPHDSFSATTGGDRAVATHWDDMHSHDDLLSSDSFLGGYRVSTSVTQPAAGGVTLNDSATVSLDGGASSVTLNHDGSHSATSQGRSLTLQPETPTQLDGTATVTLHADGSLQIADRLAANGDLSTTLKTNASGGVDVGAEAHSVDLGGYLVRDPDGAVFDAGDPVVVGTSDGPRRLPAGLPMIWPDVSHIELA